MMRLTTLILITAGITPLHAQDNVPTNKHFWYTMETTATNTAIWSIWMDVAHWKDWDTGLKDASIDRALKLGAKGTLISLEGRSTTFKVVEFTEGQSYTYQTKLPLGSLYVKRYLETNNGKTVFTHEVWFKGMTSGIFAKAFGGKFRKMLPEVLLNIKKNSRKPMNAIQLMYFANIIVAGWISITSLFFPKTAQQTIFTNAFEYSEAFRLVGALWLAIFLLSVVGLFYPKQMSLVLVFQFIYKASWLIFAALPAIRQATPYPKAMSVFFLIWVIILPFIIPWKELFD